MTDKNANGFDAEEMTVELELDDGQLVNCAIITILTVDKKDYIAPVSYTHLTLPTS